MKILWLILGLALLAPGLKAEDDENAAAQVGRRFDGNSMAGAPAQDGGVVDAGGAAGSKALPGGMRQGKSPRSALSTRPPTTQKACGILDKGSPLAAAAMMLGGAALFLAGMVFLCVVPGGIFVPIDAGTSMGQAVAEGIGAGIGILGGLCTFVAGIFKSGAV